MASLTSVTDECCEYEKSSAAIDVIHHGGGGSTKSSPGPSVIDEGVISSGKSSPAPAVIDYGGLALNGGGNSSPDTAAIDEISSEESDGLESLNYSFQFFQGISALPEIESGFFPFFQADQFSQGRESFSCWFVQRESDGQIIGVVGAVPTARFSPLSVEYLPPDLGDTSGTRLPNEGAFMEVEQGNWETGRLITGMRFGRGSADLTPTSPDFRLTIMNEPQAANSPSILEQPHRRFNQAMIVSFVASELSSTALGIQYEESQMVAYFTMCTVCLMISMYIARLRAPLEGGTERFSVYLKGFSFVFLGLLRFLGGNGSLVTALKIFLGMSQVVMYWWTSGILQTYLNAFGMRRT